MPGYAIITPMGLEVDDPNEDKTNSTPKLSLSKLLSKPSEPIQMLTPPLHQSLSVPFRWEVAPGKSRSSTDAAAITCSTPSKIASARQLDLPPRLMLNDDRKISIMPSTATVLDRPYVGRSLSLACTFSFRKGVVTARKEGARLKKRGGARDFGSGRWGSFKEGGKFSLSDAFKNEKEIERLERRSFFNLCGMKYDIWADTCASFRHAVPWRRRR